MPDLAAFQHGFIDALREAGARPGPLAVYRNTSLAGAIEALRANYLVTAAIVGHDMFGAIAVEFADAHPPRSPVLAAYGQGFADWIEEQPWAADIPYLPDVARCERLHIETLFAADAAPLTGAMLVEIEPADWADIRLHLHPATRFGWATTPAMSIWLAHQNNSCAELAPEWRSQGGLFSRPLGMVQARILDPAAHRFLFGIRVGETVGATALATASLYPLADISGLFASLVSDGVFAAPTAHERIS